MLNEVGYLSIDKTGADRFSQFLAAGCEKACTILSTNCAYNKHSQRNFNNDATVTAARLTRLLHHVQTIMIEDRSYGTKNKINPT